MAQLAKALAEAERAGDAADDVIERVRDSVNTLRARVAKLMAAADGECARIDIAELRVVLSEIGTFLIDVAARMQGFVSDCEELDSRVPTVLRTQTN